MLESQEKKSPSQNQSLRRCVKCRNEFLGKFCPRCGGLETVAVEDTLKTMPRDSDMFKGGC